MYDDLKSFNAKWVGNLLQCQLPPNVVEAIPSLPDHTDRKAVTEIAGCMTSACTKLLVSVNEMTEVLKRKEAPACAETPSIQTVSMLHDWFTLVRLMAKDARSGHYGAMFNMHLSWAEVQFLSAISNADINSLAVRFASIGRPVLAWAWPNLFKGAGEVHPNLYESYAVALAA